MCFEKCVKGVCNENKLKGNVYSVRRLWISEKTTMSCTTVCVKKKVVKGDMKH